MSAYNEYVMTFFVWFLLYFFQTWIMSYFRALQRSLATKCGSVHSHYNMKLYITFISREIPMILPYQTLNMKTKKNIFVFALSEICLIYEYYIALITWTNISKLHLWMSRHHVDINPSGISRTTTSRLVSFLYINLFLRTYLW
jgi:hypothetical protein